MKRTRLRTKDVNKELEQYAFKISKEDHLELLEKDNLKLLLINQNQAFFWYGNQWVPTLRLLQQNPLLKTITIDMGAIKFIVNGADIMRPGIVDVDLAIKKDDFIVIIDQKNKKPIAIGISLYDGSEIQTLTTGKVVKNIHYLGDDLWIMEAK